MKECCLNHYVVLIIIDDFFNEKDLLMIELTHQLNYGNWCDEKNMNEIKYNSIVSYRNECMGIVHLLITNKLCIDRTQNKIPVVLQYM